MTTIAPNFTLEEMPCYTRASASDVAKLTETVDRVLEPIREVFGEVVVTSWKWWDAGCTLRTGSAHQQGGTVDFVTPQSSLMKVFGWGTLFMPRDYVGRWIYEPSFPAVLDAAGNVVKPAQGEHIHVAPIADMVAEFGSSYGDSAAYVETSRDVYTPVAGWGGSLGTQANPIKLGGVSVALPSSIPAWEPAAVGLVVALAIAHHLHGG